MTSPYFLLPDDLTEEELRETAEMIKDLDAADRLMILQVIHGDIPGPA